ncbi:MAG: hypothetical protein LLG20_15630 [Acidobacteriales bacterium]|nr:hypothetical protein [Terriglobales bacterium]
MKNQAWWFLIALILVTATGYAQVRGGMLNPAVDVPSKPFSYFWHPTDVIGALYAPVATEVTPEGYLYTGFGELMFFVGNPPESVNQRIKTLHKGYLPIVEYDVEHSGVRYRFRMFGADLGGGMAGVPINFVEVEMRNGAKETRTAFLSSAYRFRPPMNGVNSEADYRFEQRFDLMPPKFTEGNTTFNKSWKYSLTRNALLRDDRVLYLFPDQPEPHQTNLSLMDTGFRKYRYLNGRIAGGRDSQSPPDPHTPMGVVTYAIHLDPGASRSLVFKIPLAPVPLHSDEMRQLEAADYNEQFQRTTAEWEDRVGKNPRLRFPEQKVQDFLLANTVWDLLAIDKRGDDYVPNVNKFQYHTYYGGCDTAHMMVALDYMGLQDIARKALLYSVKAQDPSGAFVTDKQKLGDYEIYESFGYALWGWGRHYQLTRDSEFLKQIYPGVVRGIGWLEGVTKTDPLGLIPAMVDVPDDAGLSGVHQTGQNLWILVGLRNAVSLADAIGNGSDAERFRAIEKSYRAAFDKQLATQTAKTGGYIPPALDQTLGGNDWDNMLLLYPEPLFEPFDPRVTSSIRKARQGYLEGILSYVLPIAVGKKGEDYEFDTVARLHYWHTQDHSENALVRGGAEDQEAAVRDLYACLLHTTSTHAPQEFGTYPWSDRDIVGHDILPDGPASGKTIELLRNMLVREYGNDLYLYSALSPTWLQPGQAIVVDREPTTFGPISTTLRVNADGFQVTLSNEFRQAPARMLLRVPWFFDARHANADGRAAPIKNGHIEIAPATHTVVVQGRIRADVPALSFDHAVQEYKREYRARYAEFLRTGKIRR